jgi:hypothetical protein
MPSEPHRGPQRRRGRAIADLNLAYRHFTEVLESVQRLADVALRTAADEAGIRFTDDMSDDLRAAPLRKAHAASLDRQEGKVVEAHRDYARAITRAVRVGVFAKRRDRAGKVSITAPDSLKHDPAVQAACKWVAIHQSPFGDYEALRRPRSRLERRIKAPMTEREFAIAVAAFTAMRSGGENWAAVAQRALTEAGVIAPMSRQAFHQRLRRLEILPRSPIQITPLRLTLRRPRPS